MTQHIKRAKVEVVPEDDCLSQGQIVESHSKLCDNLSCITSVTMSHSGYSSMDKVLDTVQSEDIRREFKELTDSLKTISSELDHQKEVYETKNADNKSLSNLTKTMIRKQREEIKHFFDKLESDMDAKVDKVTENNVKRQELVEKLQSNLKVLMSGILDTHKSEQQLSTTMKKTKEGIKILQDDFDKLKEENTIGHYKYQPSLQIQEMMLTVKEFGTLIETDPVREMEQPDGKSTGKPAESSQNVSPSANTAEETKANNLSPNQEKTNTEQSVVIHARMKEDEQQCTITGVCSLPDGYLVVVDCGNRSVKMIDANNNKTVSIIAMESDPHDVTKVTDNIVAVTLFFKRQIQFLSVSQTKELSVSNVLEASSPCYGILHSKDKLTVTHKNKLEVLDMNGKILQSFTTDSAGNQLFHHAKYLTQSPDHNTMYVSDYNSNTVTSLTTDGKVKAIYKHPELQMPFGLAVDSAGFVYVCGYNSNNIHKMSADLLRGQVMLDSSDGVVMPQSIAYCAEQNRLYVGMWCNDTIRAYQL